MGAEPRLFILSPALLGGVRAKRLIDAEARLPLACRLQTESVPIGELFSHVSSLYFRGKLSYAEHFTHHTDGSAVVVLAPGFGLVSSRWPVTAARFAKMRSTPVDAAADAYRLPLRRCGRRLAAQLGASGTAVFLGSLAPDKYLGGLSASFGARLLVPAAFVGLGQMQRGALLLRAVALDAELDYVITIAGSPAP